MLTNSIFCLIIQRDELPKQTGVVMVITDPSKVLKNYVLKHYSENLPVIDHPEGYYVDLVVSVDPEMKLRVLLSRVAPAGARPVLESVRSNEKLVWHYKRDYVPTVPFGEHHTVHLYRYESQWFQVYVRLRSEPKFHEVLRVSKFDDRDLPCLHALLLRQKVAREWGCKTHSPDMAEKKALKALKSP